MKTVEELAREAGYGDAMSSLHLPALERFAALIREALVAELVAASGEPVEVIGSYKPWYTPEQLAGAVLRERERCAQIAEDVSRKYGQQHNASAENIADECAAAIRGQT